LTCSRTCNSSDVLMIRFLCARRGAIWGGGNGSGGVRVLSPCVEREG
jgi:hypothetical protein